MIEGEGRLSPKEMDLETKVVPEKKQDEEPLYQDNWVEIYHPLRPAIPSQEGLQLTIEPRQKDDPMGELRAAYLGLAGAKVMSEGRYTEEFWANIHKNAHPGTEEGVNVWGRHPQSPEGWGKPVNIRKPEERENQPLDAEQRAKLQRTLELYIPRWERAAERITLFEQGINAIEPQSEGFRQADQKAKEAPWPWQSIKVWMNDRFSLSIALQPHIKGIHLVCDARPEYWAKPAEKSEEGVPREEFRYPEKYPGKTWETPKYPEGSLEYLKGYLESYVILMGVKEALEKQGRYFNSEIHFSGNWGFIPLDASSAETAGKTVDRSYLEEKSPEALRERRKNIKREHLRESWASSSPGWGSHGHLYGTDSPENYVHLPSRPRDKRPEEWKNIPEWDEEKALQIRNLLQSELTSWLQENFERKNLKER